MRADEYGRVAAILAKAQNALDDDLVPVDIFNDADLFQAEMENIFTKTWVFVAHESEIPESGDYVLRRIGLDPVIVTRDGDRRIHVISNYCRHRGTELCQTDRGNASRFRCRYHGWVYKNNGDWAGAPHMKEAYGGPLDAKEWGLFRAPHVASHQGLIFACLAEDAPSLQEFLGGAGWMLDMIMGVHPDGMRIAAPPDRSRLKTDWKIPAENFAGDLYHLDVAHMSVETIKLARGLGHSCEMVETYEFENGHNFGGHAFAKHADPSLTYWGYPPDISAQFDLSPFDALQQDVLKNAAPSVGTIFPNLSFVRLFAMTDPNKRPVVFTSFRQWQPVAPGVVELWDWFMVWNFMTDEQARDSYRTGQFSSGVGGLIEQDDTAIWQGAARAATSPWLRASNASFNLQQGRASEVDQAPDPGWTGPGVHRMTSYGEHQQLSFYRQWLKSMRKGRS